MTILIASDDPSTCDAVRNAARDRADMTVLQEVVGAHGTLTALRTLRPDLLLLDADMPWRYSGPFVPDDDIRSTGVQGVVIVSAADAQARRAFDTEAIDFVPKPIECERMCLALTRAQRRLSRSRPVIRRLAIRERERVILIPARDVDWFEASGNYVSVHVQTHAYRMRASLRTLAERLEPRTFARIHRSTIVNLDRIREVQPWFGGDYVAILDRGVQLRVSRTFAPSLLEPLQ